MGPAVQEADAPQLMGFDLEALVPDAARRDVIRSETAEIRTLVESAALAAVRIGNALQRIRDALDGNTALFRRFLLTEFGWASSMGYRFLLVAERMAGVDPDVLASFDSRGIYLLCRRAVPPSAIADAVQRAQAGEVITAKAAAAIAAEHGAAPTRSDAGKHRKPLPAKAVATTLARALDALAADAQAVVDGLSREQRLALADRLMRGALRIRDAAAAAAA